ncbi:hypothetical protein ABE007_15505 [Bacillus altitudinis]|uniref:hypothetical protein n=1 Tax=Bacillus altitudinis TaxID=293387 RepID=UPI003D20C487
MITFTIKFELVTGKQVLMNLVAASKSDLDDELNQQWVGTTDEKVNMNHVIHYVVN